MLPIGIISALDSEARLLVGKRVPRKSPTCIEQNTALVFVCGMGQCAAKLAAQELIQLGAKYLISWGTVGSLSEKLSPGDLFLPDQVCCNTDQYIVDQRSLTCIKDALNPHMRVVTGRLLSSSKVVETIEQKRQFQTEFNALAVDMESASIAEQAERAGIPFIVIRSVVDAHDQGLPKVAVDSVDEFGSVQPMRLAKQLITSPQEVIELIKLGHQFGLASRTLRAFRKNIPDLPGLLNNP